MKLRNLAWFALLVMGCAGPPAKVEGKYLGYVGGEYSGAKMGMNLTLTRTDSVVLGKGTITYDAINLMLTQQELKDLRAAIREGNAANVTTFTTDFEIKGNLSGPNLKMTLTPAAPAKFEVQFHGKYSDATQGGPKLGGEAQIYKEGKKVDTRPFTLKPEGT